MKIGASFVPTQAIHLDLDPLLTLQEITKWPVSVIRLSANWSECQPTETDFRFDTLIEQLRICQQAQKEIVLVIGMKALRWPEYYFPQFVKADPHNTQTQRTFLAYLKKLLEVVTQFPCIKYWQVENEPLNPSGPKRQSVSHNFLSQEIEQLKQYDNRPIVLTAWGNDLSQSQAVKKLASLADVVGIDLYFQQYLSGPLGFGWHVGPRDSITQLKKILGQEKKELWVSELQAEPWEKDEESYRAKSPTSCSLLELQNWFKTTSELPVSQIHFWGVEYWVWRAQNGDQEYVNWAKSGFPLL